MSRFMRMKISNIFNILSDIFLRLFYFRDWLIFSWFWGDIIFDGDFFNQISIIFHLNSVQCKYCNLIFLFFTLFYFLNQNDQILYIDFKINYLNICITKNLYFKYFCEQIYYKMIIIQCNTLYFFFKFYRSY